MGELLGGRPLAEPLAAVLARLATGLGAQMALAFGLPQASDPCVLAVYPQAASGDPAMVAAIGGLIRQDRAGPTGAGPAAGSWPAAQLPFSGRTLLLVPGRRSGQDKAVCAIALIGNGHEWSAESHAAVRAVASVLAARLHDFSATAGLGESRAAGGPGRLAEIAPVGIAQTDSARRIVYVNDRWCALTGMAPRDAVGALWTIAVHPDDISRVEREGRDAFKHGAEMRTDCRLRPAGGPDVWVHAAVSPLADSGGQRAGWLAALTNISGRKREEEARARDLADERLANRRLADQTQRLRSLISAAIPGVLFTDEHGVITDLNASFCNLFGISQEPGQLVGSHAQRLMQQMGMVFARPGDFVSLITEAMQRRQPVTGQQLPCADGRTLEGDYWPVLVDGQHRGDLWLAWDMSDRTAAEQERERKLEAELAARQRAEATQRRLAKYNEQLLEAADEKARYLGAVSHELSTPLAAISACAGLIREYAEGVAPQADEPLSILEHNVGQLAFMIDELSLLNRIEAGIQPLQLTLVSIAGLLDGEVRSAAVGAEQSGITIHAHTRHGPPIHGDRHRLRQVLANLISNAVKFSRPGGDVHVSSAWDGQWWHIEVSDSGIGIPETEIHGVFGRFTRASNAQTAGLPGSGLGLSIVKAITELHAGHVSADSITGGPTTFHIRLPLHP